MEMQTSQPGYMMAGTYKNYNHTGSDKYSLVNTGSLIELIKQNSNLEVTNYQEAGTRKPERYGQQNHLVRMRPQSALINPKDTPELVISNSYDKTRALHVDFGFFRIACLNGLICGDSILGFKSRHVNFDYDGLLDFVAQFSMRAHDVTAQVDAMRSKQLSPDSQRQLALETYILKRDIDVKEIDERETRIMNYEAPRLLTTRRLDDQENTVWNVFNRIQENTLKGRRGGYSTLRPVRDIKKQVKINRFLWDRSLELAS